jgi:hypothetical protein
VDGWRAWRKENIQTLLIQQAIEVRIPQDEEMN